MNETLLDISGLSVVFERRTGLFGRRRIRVDAVDDVTFEIRPGEIVGLVGESGSGKSTIGRAALGLLEPSGGTITFDGAPIPLGSRRQMHSYHGAVQAVFQDPLSSLNPTSTVGKIIEEPLRWLRGMPKAGRDPEVCRLLDLAGLDPALRHRRPGELSGGQRQRVAIARALAPEPRLIVCDEAISALDVSTQAKIINLLDDLRRSQNIAMLFIAHDLKVVAHLCDRVGVLYHGHLMEWGPAAEINDHPRHPYTRHLLASVPSTDPEGREQRRRARAEAATGPASAGNRGGCPFASRCPDVQPECSQRPPLEASDTGVAVACHVHGSP